MSALDKGASIATEQNPVRRMDYGLGRLVSSHVFWLTFPEENDVQVKLINYGFRFFETGMIATTTRLPVGETHTPSVRSNRGGK